MGDSSESADLHSKPDGPSPKNTERESRWKHGAAEVNRGSLTSCEQMVPERAEVYPPRSLIHELFEDQVRRTPHAVAVTHSDHQVTFTELNATANQLARYLLNRGVGPDRLVGICVGRSVQMVVGLLGILKAGGAYLPLDPSYPPTRLQYMLEDAAPQLVLAHEQLRNVLPETQAEVIGLDTVLKDLTAHVTENLSADELRLADQHLVYTIYTSGSTGCPKGTAMPHRSMVNLIEWHRATFAGEGPQRVLQFAALSFDVAFQEIFTTLCTGGTLVLLDEWVRLDMEALSSLIARQSIDRLFVPPMVLQALAEYCKNTGHVPASLRDVITAGEQLRIKSEIVDLFSQMDGCRLHNHYGPTETHVVTALTLSREPSKWPALPPIGRPIQNTKVYLLDEERREVAAGVPGEIYIGGVAVARGYLGKPDLTEQHFIPDSTDPAGDGHLYRTGDFGRWLDDGTLQYLGRNDDQVKIRGFRVEIGEIEAHLSTHKNIKEAAVIVREEIPGDKRLVAYVTLRSCDSAPIEELRAHLSATLPEHMLPSAFVSLQSFPLTPNGKLDRRALPAPAENAYIARAYESPQGKLEVMLASIWQDLLQVERIGRNGDFFELGGHSLLILQMVERLRVLGFTLEGQRVFESPTLGELAAVLVRNEMRRVPIPANLIPPDCPLITPDLLPLVNLRAADIERIAVTVPGGFRNIQDIYPLAPLQEGILFHHILTGQRGDTYVLPTLFFLSSRTKLDQFIKAVQLVIERHDVLRTAILWEHVPRPLQVVYRRVNLPIDELVLEDNPTPIEQMKDLMKPDRQTMDPRQAPMMRLRIAPDTASPAWYVLLQLHHLICDHDSMEMMLTELMTCLQDRAHDLPDPVPYRDHVAQILVHGTQHDAEAFFRDKLGDLEQPTIPFGLLDVLADGNRIEEARHPFDPIFSRRVRAQARRLGVSTATLFHAAWGLVLSATTGQDDIVFGTVLLGRLLGSSGIQRMLGIFINTLPLRLRLGTATAQNLVEQTHSELGALLNHEQASLAVAQRCSGVSGSGPLFSTLLNYRHSVLTVDSEDSATERPNAPQGIEVLASSEWTNYPITLSVDDFGDSFSLTVHSDRQVDPRRMTTYMHTAMQSLVGALEHAPETSALNLRTVPVFEQNQIIESFNATQSSFPHEGLIHELFEKQVERTPTAVAVVYEGDSLTYADLNTRANLLARYLRQNGVGPDHLVGLCVERSLEMLVGLLAILKAGGAYVPIDPSFPNERLACILADCRPSVLLTQAQLRPRLPATEATVVALDTEWRSIVAEVTDSSNLPRADLCPDNLAYVIYTSGSTGLPKGVMVEHRNVVGLWQCIDSVYQQTRCQNIAINASITFDSSVKQLVQILSGRSLFVISQETRSEPSTLLQYLISNHIHGVDCTPSQLKSWISAGLLQGECALRVVLIGGEAISPELWSTLGGSNSVEFYNVYGPTECTVDSTIARLQQGIPVPHIGRPLANTRVYILNRKHDPVPTAVEGQIYVGGAGVARGYLNRPNLTAERFVPDPFSGAAAARMYKTGDLGRWRADGTIEYLGRNDSQVKIRGFRIELGEIEAQLRRGERVKDAVVIAFDDDSGQKRLVAYVTQGEPGGVTAEGLRTHLKSVLPDYMVPAAFVVLQRFPLTPNGKLDRRGLPAPDLAAFARSQYEAAQGEVENILARIWTDLLKVERVGRYDNFFELGGHSLLAMQVIARVRSLLSVDLPMRSLFEWPTLEALASEVDNLRQTRLLETIAVGGEDIEGLLDKIARMPEAEAQALIRELTVGAKP